jgi:hypothetical protein
MIIITRIPIATMEAVKDIVLAHYLVFMKVVAAVEVAQAAEEMVDTKTLKKDVS